jgi:hypothetical protein
MIPLVKKVNTVAMMPLALMSGNMVRIQPKPDKVETAATLKALTEIGRKLRAKQ